MEMLGEHNKRLEQYDDFVTGPDPIQRLEFIDNNNFYASNGNEVSLFTQKIDWPTKLQLLIFSYTHTYEQTLSTKRADKHKCRH